jgi:phage replication initiation protein
MEDRFNSLGKFTGLKKKTFSELCALLRDHRSLGITRQSIERGKFSFDYKGEADGFEAVKATKDHKGKPAFINVPLYNESAAPNSGIIDWVNFTFRYPHDEPELAVLTVSAILETILGYGVTGKYDKGRNFYKQAYILGNHWGLVCIGGQSETVLVMINGDGCTAAREGWQQRLHNLATHFESRQFRITRVDVAHDLFDGEYTVDDAVFDYDNGLFGTGGRVPKIQQYGNWRIPDDTAGRTVYFGTRKSGKYCRVYEKGKQLGEGNSPWVRIECEWHNKNRDIPYDILLEPGRYLSGAYPAFMWLDKVQSRIRTKTKKEHILYEKAVEIAKHQLGGLILLMTKVENSAEDIVTKIVGHKIPKRFISPDWQDFNKTIYVT